MDALCIWTRGIRKMEIIKFVADFDMNKEVGKLNKNYITFSQ